MEKETSLETTVNKINNLLLEVSTFYLKKEETDEFTLNRDLLNKIYKNDFENSNTNTSVLIKELMNLLDSFLSDKSEKNVKQIYFDLINKKLLFNVLNKAKKDIAMEEEILNLIKELKF